MDRSRLIAEKLAQVASAVSDLNRSIQQEILRTSRPSVQASSANCPIALSGCTMSIDQTLRTSSISQSQGFDHLGQGVSGSSLMEQQVAVCPGQDSASRSSSVLSSTTPFVESRFYWGPMDTIPPSFFERSEDDISRSLNFISRKAMPQPQSDLIDSAQRLEEHDNREVLESKDKIEGHEHQEVLESKGKTEGQKNHEVLEEKDEIEGRENQEVIEEKSKTEERKNSEQFEGNENQETNKNVDTNSSLDLSQLEMPQKEMIPEKAISEESNDSFHSSSMCPEEISIEEEMMLTSPRPWTKEDFISNTLNEISNKLDVIERKLTNPK